MNHTLDHIREKELISNNMLTEQSNWRLRNNSSCTALETRQHIERWKKKKVRKKETFGVTIKQKSIEYIDLTRWQAL